MIIVNRPYTRDAIRSSTIESKIALYEERIRGWFHDPARILEKRSEHCGFILLMVAIAYIEGHAIFLKGESSQNRSREFFRIGFREVFNCTMPDKVIDEIYAQVRCGLFHHGSTSGKVILSGAYKVPISVRTEKDTDSVAAIYVNPHLVLDAVQLHLSKYVGRLRDSKETELRENFERALELT